VAIDVETNGGTQKVDLRNDTAVARGPMSVAILAATQASGGAVTVNLFNTIAIGGTGPNAADVEAATPIGGTATINTNHSDYATAVENGPGAAVNTSLTDRHVPPALDPTTFRETAASSSTIGKGAVDPNSGPLDFEGDLRSIGGQTDIGADQYVAAPPAISDVAGAGADGHATITATIDTEGAAASYSVSYGSTASYGLQSATFSLPASETPQPVSIPLDGLTPGASYHFAVKATTSAGTSASPDTTFTGTVTPPALGAGAGSAAGPGAGTAGAPGAASGVPPQVSALVFSRSAFAAGSWAGAAAAAQRRRAPIGTWISYTDSQPATTTLTVARRTSGTVVRGGRCVAVRGRHRVAGAARRCWLYAPVGAITHLDQAGRNRVPFTGWIAGHKLRAGAYRMSAVPVNARHQRGRARVRSFTIIARGCR
jgi:hypothetical protein